MTSTLTQALPETLASIPVPPNVRPCGATVCFIVETQEQVVATRAPDMQLREHETAGKWITAASFAVDGVNVTIQAAGPTPVLPMEANWKPLEQHRYTLAGDFDSYMFMYSAGGLNYYKHRDTRGYLVLDDEGQPYADGPDGGRVGACIEDALAAANRGWAPFFDEAVR